MTIIGKNSADSENLVGTSIADLMFGHAGDDTLAGGLDRDTIHGGRGNDLIYGNEGDDRLFGDLGNDTLFGNAGANTLSGGEGNDMFVIDSQPGVTTVIEDFQGNALISGDILWFTRTDVPRSAVVIGSDLHIVETAAGEQPHTIAILQGRADLEGMLNSSSKFTTGKNARNGKPWYDSITGEFDWSQVDGDFPPFGPDFLPPFPPFDTSNGEPRPPHPSELNAEINWDVVNNPDKYFTPSPEVLARRDEYAADPNAYRKYLTPVDLVWEAEMARLQEVEKQNEQINWDTGEGVEQYYDNLRIVNPTIPSWKELAPGLTAFGVFPDGSIAKERGYTPYGQSLDSLGLI